MTYTLTTTRDEYRIVDAHGNEVDSFDLGATGYARAYERLNALNTRAAELAAVVSDPATWEAVSEPRCELCGEPAVLVGEQWTCPGCAPIGDDDEDGGYCEWCGEWVDFADADEVEGEMLCELCARSAREASIRAAADAERAKSLAAVALPPVDGFLMGRRTTEKALDGTEVVTIERFRRPDAANDIIIIDVEAA